MSNAKTANVYDFDHTIYGGNASLDFIIYCLRKNPQLWKHLPRQAFALAQYILGTSSRGCVKQAAFVFLRDIKDIDATLEAFWNTHQHKIAKWYIAQQQSTDIVISASPAFLLQPICNRLGITSLLATPMNPATGVITGKNCRGPEKLRRLKAHDASLKINSVYSDHLSDKPLFDAADQAFVVEQGKIIPLATYKPSKWQALQDPAFIRFLLVGGINASLGIIFSYGISLLITSPLVAYAIGYAISLVISYFLNAVITFKEARFSVKQFISFCLSYIPNFLVVFAIVYVLAGLMHLYSLIAYILAAIIAAPITFLLLSNVTFTGKRGDS